jgi:nitroimidazol reductase NimA-like FMN-containing flavoprotein (pyridoxamine 5'-phosphate oxidase superfamily)
MSDLLERMKRFLKENDLCVLATCSANIPHCSLMAYVTDETGSSIYLVTLRDTRKYRNLSENPRVSLLVDSRTGVPTSKRGNVLALTVYGTVQEIDGAEERARVLRQLSQRHPHLGGLISQQNVAPFSVRIRSMLLLDGALDAQFITLEEGAGEDGGGSTKGMETP